MSATSPAVKAYRITITMPDGSQGTHEGLYEDGFAAAQSAKENFPDAKRISAQALHSARAAQLISWHQRTKQLAQIALSYAPQAHGERA